MTKWLSKDQQAVWRSWIAASTLLPFQLGKDLQTKHGLTISDYEILVHLSESPERSMRMSELADRVLLSRSRLTHQIDRMEISGFVTRVSCPGDKRGQLATMTEAGWVKLVAAAPDHVTNVRKHMLDVLTPAEFDQLGKSMAKVAAHLKSLKSD